MPGAMPASRLAGAATIVALLVYVIGLAASTRLPEPSSDKLPE
jgi:hypothetical protein